MGFLKTMASCDHLLLLSNLFVQGIALHLESLHVRDRCTAPNSALDAGCAKSECGHDHALSPSFHFWSASMTWSTSFTSANRLRWLSRMSSGLPPLSVCVTQACQGQARGDTTTQSGARPAFEITVYLLEIALCPTCWTNDTRTRSAVISLCRQPRNCWQVFVAQRCCQGLCCTRLLQRNAATAKCSGRTCASLLSLWRCAAK